MIANIVIIAVIAVAAFFAARTAARHFSGKGACCSGGGSDFIPEEDKRIGAVVEEKKIRVEGMTCENCANTVKRAINSVEGASGQVNLRKGVAVISCDRKIDEAAVKGAIERAGYRVVSIS